MKRHIKLFIISTYRIIYFKVLAIDNIEKKIEGKISQKRTFLVKSIRHAILLPEKEAPTKVVFSKRIC